MKIDDYKLGLIEGVLRLEDWREAIRHDEVVALAHEIRSAWKFITGIAEECASRDLRLRALEYLGREESGLTVQYHAGFDGRPKLTYLMLEEGDDDVV